MAAIGQFATSANVIVHKKTFGCNLRLVLAWLRAFMRIANALATHPRSNQLVNEQLG
jgi:hypothetical protein